MHGVIGGTTDHSYSLVQRVRIIFGVLLVAIGVIAAVFVIVNLFKIFGNPKEIEVFKQIVPYSQELRTMVIDGKEVVLPVSIFNFLAYGVCIGMLAVGGMLASTFISSGVNLMVGNVTRLEMRIKGAIETIKGELESIKDQLSSKEK